MKKTKMKYTVAIELLILSALFTVLTLTVDVRAIGPQNTKVGLSHLNAAVHDAVGTNMTLYKISEILGYFAFAIIAIFALMGLLQLVKNKKLLAVDSTILALGGLYLITLMLYVVFDKLALNYRPVIMPGETAPEASYPSSHTMLAFVVFGSAAMIIAEFVSKESLAKLLKWVLIILLIITVVCRFLSGVHWVTDIIASILIGSTLLAFFSAVRSSINGRDKGNQEGRA